MDVETKEKHENGFARLRAGKSVGITIFVLRLASFLATAAATIVMALNKETKSIVVATIGSNPVTVQLTAKFQHTPAFVFFVIANAVASFHSLLMIALGVFRHKLNHKELFLVMIPILDTLVLALVSAGNGAAAFMAEVGKNGNSHARWNKICDRFGNYCDRSSGSLAASFIGVALLLVVTLFSIIKLIAKPRTTSHNVTA